MMQTAGNPIPEQSEIVQQSYAHLIAYGMQRLHGTTTGMYVKY